MCPRPRLLFASSAKGVVTSLTETNPFRVSLSDVNKFLSEKASGRSRSCVSGSPNSPSTGRTMFPEVLTV